MMRWLVPVIALVLPVGFAANVSESPSKAFTAKQRSYWAFQPVKASPLPVARQSSSIRNPVDAFVLSKLEEKKLTPSPEADKVTLLRRVTFSLTGLPPSEQEINSFLADVSPDAYEKAVDRLLASPRYGERWARHWLDLARYADSDGFKADHTRPNIWRYRDYVVRAFNSDKPYDRFIKEQLV